MLTRRIGREGESDGKNEEILSLFRFKTFAKIWLGFFGCKSAKTVRLSIKQPKYRLVDTRGLSGIHTRPRVCKRRMRMA